MARSNTSHRSKSGHGKNSPPSYNSVMLKDEVNAMLDTIERGRNVGSENNKNRAILAVLSNDDAAESLTKRLRPSPWATLKVWSKPKKQGESCLVMVTTRKRLSQTIGKLDLYEDIESVFMLVSCKIHNISFDVCGENINDLKIVRCDAGQEGNVTISGGSTFGGTRLDQWQVNSERRLYIGEHGVQIRVEDPSAIPGWADAHKSPATTVVLDRVRDLKTQLENTEGAPSNSWTEWWDKWKGPAAAAVGIATATTKFTFALNGAVGGVAIRHTLKSPLIMSTTEVMAFGAKLSSVLTAAGPAVLLGMATAAAVYFVPWETFFGWLGDAIKSIFKAFSSLWEWFLGWWEGFKKWMDAAFNPSKLRQHAAGFQNVKHGHRQYRQRY